MCSVDWQEKAVDISFTKFPLFVPAKTAMSNVNIGDSASSGIARIWCKE